MGVIDLGLVVTAFLLYCLSYVPVEYGLSSTYIFDTTTTTGSPSTYELPDVTASFDSVLGYPLIIKPNSLDIDLKQFVTTNAQWLNDKLPVHGAILFRGFNVSTPQQFEQISLVLEPNLEEVYLGTSPRELQTNTTYVHSASEFPGWKVIPSHCEMSFLVDPPKRQFFYAHHPNTSPGGETPLIDFKAIRDDMDPQILKRFKQKKIRYIRHYYDEHNGNMLDNYLDPFKTKSWQNMFKTNDTTIVEQKCKKQSFTTQWSEGNGGGTLKLVHTMDATRVHPHTGEEIWFNHMNVLHIDSWLSEFAYSAQHLNSWTYVAYHYVFKALVGFQRNVLYGGDVERFGQHTTHANGERMSQTDVDYIRRMVWKHTLPHRHEQYDVLMVDNLRMGHGRQPFTGKRVILTTWA
eukprot:279988_1